jgi:hypothetical protein
MMEQCGAEERLDDDDLAVGSSWQVYFGAD